MGYEIKLVIGTRGYDRQDKWVGVVATLDLCKCGYGGAITQLNEERKSDDGKTYYYADDGNTQVKKDSYDDPLRVRTLAETVKALEDEIKADPKHPYRRFVIALALLKAIDETFGEKVVVLFYGY
jgi:hypothetical protein